MEPSVYSLVNRLDITLTDKLQKNFSIFFNGLVLGVNGYYRLIVISYFYYLIIFNFFLYFDNQYTHRNV